MAVIRLLRYFSFFPKLSVPWVSFTRCLHELLAYCIVLVVIIFAFVLMVGYHHHHHHHPSFPCPGCPSHGACTILVVIMFAFVVMVSPCIG
jgi:hypothetical protein